MVTVNETNREPDGTFGALEADTLVGADVQNATDGTVPTSQGDGTMAMEGIPSTGINWEKEQNSPQVVNSQNSITYTMSNNSPDYIRVFYRVSDLTGSANSLGLRFNGNDGFNYNFMKHDGTSSFGSKQFEDVDIFSGGETVTGSLIFASGQEGGISFQNGSGSPNSETAVGGEIKVESWPPNDFSLLRGVESDYTVNVYTLELET